MMAYLWKKNMYCHFLLDFIFVEKKIWKEIENKCCRTLIYYVNLTICIRRKKVTQNLLFIILCFPSLPHPPSIIIIWFYKITMICKYFLKKAVLFFVHFIHTCNIFNPYYLLFIHNLNWKKNKYITRSFLKMRYFPKRSLLIGWINQSEVQKNSKKFAEKQFLWPWLWSYRKIL